jgi:hypothetical protein
MSRALDQDFKHGRAQNSRISACINPELSRPPGAVPGHDLTIQDRAHNTIIAKKPSTTNLHKCGSFSREGYIG